MDFWRKIGGIIRAEVTSADLYKTMEAISASSIPIWDVEQMDALTVRFSLSKSNWGLLENILDQRGDSLVLLERVGAYWTVIGFLKRPVLILGLLLFVLFTLWVPGKIFFVQVEGNRELETRRILEAAADCGVTFGASGSDVRSEHVKNLLLEAIPQLSWAGVNTYGCTAVISVQEKKSEQNMREEQIVSSIIASRDGVIREMTVLQGNGLCRVGQVVKAGQVLISGYTDCGIAIRATRAKGEIYAQTNRILKAVCPLYFQNRGEILSQEKKYSFIIGKKRIIFSNNSRISGAGCAKIYSQKYVTLPGGFVLPIAICVQTSIRYETRPQSWQPDISAASKTYLLQSMIAGKILQSSEEIMDANGVLTLHGSYSCYEMIGISKLEEQISDYGKND